MNTTISVSDCDLPHHISHAPAGNTLLMTFQYFVWRGVDARDEEAKILGDEGEAVTESEYNGLNRSGSHLSLMTQFKHNSADGRERLVVRKTVLHCHTSKPPTRHSWCIV